MSLSGRLQVRWLCVPNGSSARSDGLAECREIFAGARVVGHRALLDDASIQRRNGWHGEWGALSPLDDVFELPSWEGWLGGEPFYVLYAPARSWTDHLVVFRGCLLTGDWPLDAGDEEGCVVPVEARTWVRTHIADAFSGRYAIHTLIPSDGPPRVGIDVVGWLLAAER